MSILSTCDVSENPKQEKSIFDDIMITNLQFSPFFVCTKTINRWINSILGIDNLLIQPIEKISSEMVINNSSFSRL